MKQATHEEWIEIGHQAKKARNELVLLLSMCSHKMPKAIISLLQTSILALDRFRSSAEDRMLRTSENQDLTTFYK